MPGPRTLAPGQSSRIRIADVATGRISTVHESHTVLFEAPNWTSSDELLLNADGVLWRLPVDGSSEPSRIPVTGLPALNNDHVLDPDGAHVYVSADDGRIYRAPLAGGEARRITHGDGSTAHYLHGVSPDGAWIYFTTEQFSTAAGHAQIARMRTDGSALEQLTVDDDVNWFPHLAPDVRSAVYLAFPPGTVGHPADRTVHLRLVRDGDWRSPRTVHTLPGGQGTINVNSWSPRSDRFAFVDYPVGGRG